MTNIDLLTGERFTPQIVVNNRVFLLGLGSDDVVRLTKLRDWFESLIQAARPGTTINGSLTRRVPGNSSLFFPGIDAEALIANLPEVLQGGPGESRFGIHRPSRSLQVRRNSSPAPRV